MSRKIGDGLTPQRRFYLNNKERRHADARAWREANPEKNRASKKRSNARPEFKAKRAADQREWRRKNPDTVRDYKLRQQFGITLEQWRAMLVAQGGRCACCRSPDPRDRRGWHTDHDHVTGAVRGLVCAKCNHTLGMLGDNADAVRASCAMYLAYLDPPGNMAPVPAVG